MFQEGIWLTGQSGKASPVFIVRLQVDGKSDAVSSRRLGEVERLVRPPYHVVEAEAGRRTQIRDKAADTASDVVTEVFEFRYQPSQSFRDFRRLFSRCLWHEDDELLSPVPAGDIRLSQPLFDGPADGFQHFIA